MVYLTLFLLCLKSFGPHGSSTICLFIRAVDRDKTDCRYPTFQLSPLTALRIGRAKLDVGYATGQLLSPIKSHLAYWRFALTWSACLNQTSPMPPLCTSIDSPTSVVFRPLRLSLHDSIVSYHQMVINARIALSLLLRLHGCHP